MNLLRPSLRLGALFLLAGILPGSASAIDQDTFRLIDSEASSSPARSCLVNELRSFFLSEMSGGNAPVSASPVSVITPSPGRRINLTQCCRETSSLRGFPSDWKVADNPLEDIYAARAEWDQRKLEHSARFEFFIPETVGSNTGLPVRQVDAYADDVATRTLVDLSLSHRGVRETTTVTYLDSGGFSDVYRARTLGGDEEVIKVRRSNSRLDLFEAGLRRDLALESVASELASQARYEQKPFVRVERWHSDAADLGRGVIRQRVIKGPKVWELANAVDEVERLRGRPQNELSPQDRAKLALSERVLRDAKLTAEEAKDRIIALEDFYRKAHAPVLAFCAENHIPPVRNRKRNGVIGVVGLDYNSGQNAAWDADSRQFVIFDW